VRDRNVRLTGSWDLLDSVCANNPHADSAGWPGRTVIGQPCGIATTGWCRGGWGRMAESGCVGNTTFNGLRPQYPTAVPTRSWRATWRPSTRLCIAASNCIASGEQAPRCIPNSRVTSTTRRSASFTNDRAQTSSRLRTAPFADSSSGILFAPRRRHCIRDKHASCRDA